MNETTLPDLKGPHLLLRQPYASDIEARLALGRDPEVFRGFGASRHSITPMTREAAELWVARMTVHGHAWMIDNDGLIGEARLDKLDHTDRRATFAIGIYDPARLGKGLGTEAAQLVLHYAFSTLKLHRVSLRVLAYNSRAIASYKKCGFVIEGRQREAACVDGVWEDDIIMGIIDREFVTPPFLNGRPEP
ncbi:GNAT family N-acetyltransferase [Pararhizobium sp.]|uniref:GNAT family N-acetyltransferase n=1 Tax=Pararhizobium sp. TaxID=1977563 RepID=UPI00271D2492|nr:GNAT family protein [Pararhizobium sp.]MDO9414819.1 GNAT family protein [Pararhizobium sp.]